MDTVGEGSYCMEQDDTVGEGAYCREMLILYGAG